MLSIFYRALTFTSFAHVAAHFVDRAERTLELGRLAVDLERGDAAAKAVLGVDAWRRVARRRVVVHNHELDVLDAAHVQLVDEGELGHTAARRIAVHNRVHVQLVVGARRSPKAHIVPLVVVEAASQARLDHKKLLLLLLLLSSAAGTVSVGSGHRERDHARQLAVDDLDGEVAAVSGSVE